MRLGPVGWLAAVLMVAVPVASDPGTLRFEPSIALPISVSGAYHAVVPRPGELLVATAEKGDLRAHQFDFQDGRLSPTAEENILRGPVRGDFPRFATSNAWEVLAWQTQGNRSQDYDVMFIHQANGTGAWSDPRTAIPHDGRQSFPVPACAGSWCAVVWQEESSPNRGDWAVYGAMILPHVGPKVLLSHAGNGSVSQFPSAAVIDDTWVVAAWEQETPQGPGIGLARWSPASGEAQRAQVSGPDPTRFPIQAAVIAGHRVLVAWNERVPPDQQVLMYASGSLDLTSWTAPSVLPGLEPTSVPQHPVMARLGQDRFAIAWEDARNGLESAALAEFDSNLQVVSVSLPLGGATPLRQHAIASSLLGDDFFLFYKETQGYQTHLMMASTRSLELANARGSLDAPVWWFAGWALLLAAWTPRRSR